MWYFSHSYLRGLHVFLNPKTSMIFGKQKRVWSRKSNYITVIVKEKKQKALFFKGLGMCSYYSLVSYCFCWSLRQSMLPCICGRQRLAQRQLTGCVVLWSCANLNIRVLLGKAHEVQHNLTATSLLSAHQKQPNRLKNARSTSLINTLNTYQFTLSGKQKEYLETWNKLY